MTEHSTSAAALQRRRPPMTREPGAFVCAHVFDAVRPVLRASREEGDWLFHCAGSHGGVLRQHVIGLQQLLKRDPTLSEVVDLRDGWVAERTEVGAVWTRRPIVPP